MYEAYKEAHAKLYTAGIMLFSLFVYFCYHNAGLLANFPRISKDFELKKLVYKSLVIP